MHTAIVNNGRKINRPGQHPMPMQQNQQQNQAQLMAMRQQQQQQVEQQQRQQQQQQLLQVSPLNTRLIQRENDEQNSSSPAMGQGNSPNKRPRLSPPNDFQISNPIQPPNGLTPAQQQQLQNHNAAQQYLKANGVQMTPGASHAEVVNVARQVSMQLQQAGNQPNKGSVHAYKQNLAQQQSQQVMAGRTSLGGSASPAGQQATISGFPANPGIPQTVYSRTPTQAELEKLSKTAQDLGGQLTHPQSGGSHSLQDYQSQLMVLEQQNQKRLQHARQETTTRADDPGSNGGPMNGQFGGQGQLQPGHPMQGTNMSPQNSRAGPSPQIPNMEISQQRKPGQKTTSGGASPEPGDSQIRGPSPAFTGPGAMTQEHYQQMTMNHYPQGMLNQNGAGQFIGGRQHPGMPFGQGQAHIPQEMMKMSRMAQGQPGQYQPGWQQMANQQHLNQVCFSCNMLIIDENGSKPTGSTGSADKCSATTNAPSATTTTSAKRPSTSTRGITLVGKRTNTNANTRKQAPTKRQSRKRRNPSKTQQEKHRSPCHPKCNRTTSPHNSNNTTRRTPLPTSPLSTPTITTPTTTSPTRRTTTTTCPRSRSPFCIWFHRPRLRSRNRWLAKRRRR
jgi:hypothetical protein